MDTQTYNMRFESMRKRRTGMSGVGTRNNKQLMTVHKDLDRRCRREIRKHESDTRHFTTLVRHQQQSFERRQQLLVKQKDKFKLESRQNKALLDSFHRYHVIRERTFRQEIEMSRRKATDDIDIVKEIMKLTMPSHMKTRIARATLHDSYEQTRDKQESVTQWLEFC